MSIKTIEEKFDEKFPRMFAGSAGQYNKNGDTRPYYNNNVKQFIREEISESFETVMVDKFEFEDCEYRNRYNECIREIRKNIGKYIST